MPDRISSTVFHFFEVLRLGLPYLRLLPFVTPDLNRFQGNSKHKVSFFYNTAIVWCSLSSHITIRLVWGSILFIYSTLSPRTFVTSHLVLQIRKFFWFSASSHFSFLWRENRVEDLALSQNVSSFDALASVLFVSPYPFILKTPLSFTYLCTHTHVLAVILKQKIVRLKN